MDGENLMDLSRPTLAKMFPRAIPEWLESLAKLAPSLCNKYQIITARRWVHFCGQITAETAGLSIPHMRESFAYTPERLVQVFGSRVTPDQVALCREGPSAIANHVYAPGTKVGGWLGNTQPDDGWNFRGRGPVQTTGRGSYWQIGNELSCDFLSQPELLEQPDWGWRVAFADWNMEKLNPLADTDSVLAVSKKLNGGTNGLQDRIAATARAKAIWGNSMVPEPFPEPDGPPKPVSVPTPTLPHVLPPDQPVAPPSNDNSVPQVPPEPDAPPAPPIPVPPPRPTPHDVMRGGLWRMHFWMWFSRVTGIGSVSAFSLLSASTLTSAQDSSHALVHIVSDPVALGVGCAFLILAVVAAVGVYLTVRAVERGTLVPPKWVGDIASLIDELASETAGAGTG